MATMREKLEAIETERQRFQQGGGPAEIDRQHAKGKLTARERIDKLLDPGSFQEIDLWAEAYKTGFDIDDVFTPGDGVVVGSGEVGGRPIYVWSQDATVLGGTMAEIHVAKIIRVMEKALTEMVPIVGIYDSEGTRAQSEVWRHAQCTIGTMMRFQAISSGVIPQISLVMGQCTGGAALSVALSDFTFMVRNTSFLHVAPPPQGIEREQYGGARMHSRISGTCHVLAENDEDCLRKCQELLSFLPLNNTSKPPVVDTGDDPNRMEEDLLDIVPTDTYKWFDIREVIKRVVDNRYYFEIGKDYAQNLSVGFGRFDGRTAGMIASNSIWKGGCMDYKTAAKLARFVRFCDAFDIPVIYFSDCPAFLPDVEEERKGILRHGCMVIHSNSEATIPRLCIYVRKLYGGAALAFPTNRLKIDRMAAWPSVERGLMGARELTAIMFRGAMKRAKTPEELKQVQERGVERMKKAIERFSRITNEDFIDPRQTRPYIISALRRLENKVQARPARKHENINL